jgi:uncharacterized protein (TIGR02594 family)
MPITLPAAYRWLLTLTPLPRLIAEALKLYGVTEARGTADNPSIVAWAREAGCPAYRVDSQPWCGLFMAVIAKRAGKPIPDGPLWALNWQHFGTASPRPSLGDVLVFQRPSGGHVGLYVGEDATAFHVLGGNQGDRVCILRVGRDRLKTVRRPVYASMPATVRPVHLAATGAVSTNEA